MRGREVWKEWREEHPELQPDLSRASLRGSYLGKANFSGANLSGAQLYRACISRANLREAHLNNATLILANLTNVNLSGAHLNGANLSDADLSGANLRGANLSWTILSDVNLSQANLTGCSIYSTSAWNVLLKDTTQLSLIITRPDEPTITVDNLEVAQFIYLLLNNKKIRDVIDTITSKVVLILGSFTDERKVILDAIRDELRRHNYSPVLFDFEKPSSRV